MIGDFEQRLADVIGARLHAPFAGRAQVTPGDGGAGPSVLIGVRGVTPLVAEFGRPPKSVPGAADPRRVLYLQCDVLLAVKPGAGGGRAQQRQAVDDLLYMIDAPDLRDGSALAAAAADPGFLIERTALAAGALPLADAADAGTVTLSAVGWFWPPLVPGESGTAIGEIRVRGVALPLALTPAAPAAVAGGPAIAFGLRIGGGDPQRLTAPGAGAAPPLPFGRLALKLFDAGRRPGAGKLGGGSAGSDGSTLITVADGAASFSYQPPAAAAVDLLVVALEDGEGAQGLEIGRFTLRVRAA